MSWTIAFTCWPQLLDQLCTRFPYLEVSTMARFRGDRAKMDVYLAETHDLTVAEAAQALDDWLTFTAARIPKQNAA